MAVLFLTFIFLAMIRTLHFWYGILEVGQR